MSGEKILVVDDNLGNCHMMADLLEQWGYRVKEAHQGKEVLELVKQFQPDLLLLDVMLPGMNGFEICKRIKRSPEMKHVAVIMLTVLDDLEDRTRGISVGADLFISRPVSHKELQRHIESVLANKSVALDLEELQSTSTFFQNLLRQLSPELYRRTQPVLHYSGSISKFLGLGKEAVATIELGAVLQGFSYLFGSGSERLAITKRILEPLEIATNLSAYLDPPGGSICMNCTRGVRGCSSTEGAQIVYLSDLYCKLLPEMGNKNKAYVQLRKELPVDAADCPIYGALGQVLDDEAFVQKIKSGDIRSRQT